MAYNANKVVICPPIRSFWAPKTCNGKLKPEFGLHRCGTHSSPISPSVQAKIKIRFHSDSDLVDELNFTDNLVNGTNDAALWSSVVSIIID